MDEDKNRKESIIFYRRRKRKQQPTRLTPSRLSWLRRPYNNSLSGSKVTFARACEKGNLCHYAEVILGYGVVL